MQEAGKPLAAVAALSGGGRIGKKGPWTQTAFWWAGSEDFGLSGSRRLAWGVTNCRSSRRSVQGGRGCGAPCRRPVALDDVFSFFDGILAKRVTPQHVGFKEPGRIPESQYETLLRALSPTFAGLIPKPRSPSRPQQPRPSLLASPAPPGVAIDRSPDPLCVYIGSPSIAVLPSGDYRASHDFFGPGTTNSQTAVF